MNVLLLMLLNNFSIYLWQTTSQQRLMEAQGQEQEDLAGKIRANCIPSALQAKWPVSSMLRNRRQNSSKAASFMRCRASAGRAAWTRMRFWPARSLCRDGSRVSGRFFALGQGLSCHNGQGYQLAILRHRHCGWFSDTTRQ